jgi:hypothetical protein
MIMILLMVTFFTALSMLTMAMKGQTAPVKTTKTLFLKPSRGRVHNIPALAEKNLYRTFNVHLTQTTPPENEVSDGRAQTARTLCHRLQVDEAYESM